MKKKIILLIVSVLLTFCTCGFIAHAETAPSDETMPSLIETDKIPMEEAASETDYADETMPSLIETEETTEEETTSETDPSDPSAEVTYPSKGVESFTNYAFPILIYGMAGIFLVLGLIAASIYALGKFSNKTDSSDDK